MTLSTYLENYISIFKKSKIKKSTMEYYNFRKKAILKIMKDEELKEIDVFKVQNFINSYFEIASYSSVKGCFILLNQAFKKAIEIKEIKLNPCEGVELPTKSKKEIEIISEFELMQFQKTKSINQYRDIFIFMLNTGLRTSEVLGLKKIDIDFENQTINVKNNLYRGNLQSTKTKSGNRCIPMNDIVKKILLNQMKNKSDFIFVNSLNQSIDYNVLLRSWYRLQERCNFQNRYGLHSLRHTFATNLIHNGADIKTVSNLLGHKDVQTTLNFYCHTSIEDKKKAINLLNFKII